ncbi:MAG TPA: phosphoribosylanthranilate isomerase [Geobacteraceae bacterium]|nr:phosphoribosylanthranilate isomerase [Geobacteraceae bacterium]
MVKVKICGITNEEDAVQAVEAGADALGFVFYDLSPRCISYEKAKKIIEKLPPFVVPVGVFVNNPIRSINLAVERCGIQVVQLHGDETPSFCSGIRHKVVKAFRVRDISSLENIRNYPVSGFLLDAYVPGSYGGTGLTFNWETARVAKQYGPVILAGGLNAGNVRKAVESVEPYGIDVSSGVEASPGRKDHAKVAEFIKRAKGF